MRSRNQDGRSRMLVNTEGQANQRLKELEKIKNKASVEHEEAKKNRNFTQMYQRAGNALERQAGYFRYPALLF